MTTICSLLSRPTTDGTLILPLQVYGPACDVTSPVNASSLVVTVPILVKTPPTSCPLEFIHCTAGTTTRYSSTATVQVKVEDCPEMIMREEGVMVTIGTGRAVEG